MIEITKDTKITLTVEQLSYFDLGIQFWQDAQNFSLTLADGSKVTDPMQVVTVYSGDDYRRVSVQGRCTKKLAYQAAKMIDVRIFRNYMTLLHWVSDNVVLATKAEIDAGLLTRKADDYLNGRDDSNQSNVSDQPGSNDFTSPPRPAKRNKRSQEKEGDDWDKL